MAATDQGRQEAAPAATPAKASSPAPSTDTANEKQTASPVENEILDSWEHDTRNPYNWPTTKKWIVTCLASYITIIVGLNATDVSMAFEDISTTFNVHDSIFQYTYLSITAWSATSALVPMVTLPLMETYSMKWGYRIFFTLFTIFLIPQALAQNYATLIVSRVVAGASGGWFLGSMCGVVANLFQSNAERSLPIAAYTLSLVLGVTLGPVQGAIVKPLGWRWIFWLQLIIYGASLPLVFLMPETRGSVIQRQISHKSQAELAKEKQDDSQSSQRLDGVKYVRTVVVRAIVLLFTEPVVFFFTLWSAFSYALVFISTASIGIVYSQTYGWQNYSVGLVQSSIAIGEILGAFACIWANRWYVNSRSRNKENPGEPVPESILYLPVPSTFICLAGGLFMYGWSSYQGAQSPHWIVPTIGLTLVGFAIQIIVWAVTVYVAEAYSAYAASAIACVGLGANMMGAVLPLATKAMYVRLGSQWASSLLGFLALAVCVAPVVLSWKGRWVREHSRAINRLKQQGL